MRRELCEYCYKHEAAKSANGMAVCDDCYAEMYGARERGYDGELDSDLLDSMIDEQDGFTDENN